VRKDIQRRYYRCIACLQSKFKTMPHGYTPLYSACAQWEGTNMNFVFSLLKT